MARMREVHVSTEPVERFLPLLSPGERGDLERLIAETRARMAGRVFWHVNSTARGGGVAEMLQSLLAYARGAGVDARWLVLEGNDRFFHLTKRLHHALHGARGDGSPLEDAQRQIYEAVQADNAEEYLAIVDPRDVLLLHDPQTAGMAPLFARRGLTVVWRCHVGTEEGNDEVAAAWAFLEPYLAAVHAAVFSRAAYVPPFLLDRSVVIPPTLDIFSPKNEPLPDEKVRAILAHVGIVEPSGEQDDRSFLRADGAPARVDRRAEIVRVGPPPRWETPLVVQVSRWDPLKDPIGVLKGFVRMLRERPSSDAALVLAGPEVRGVTDDPEGVTTFDQVVAEWRALPERERARIHLVCLPMADVEENAVMVNALQRHAAVIVQKSLREGFGLTVLEGMWKARPLLASAVGGINDQITDGVEGVLLEDPSDPAAFSAALWRLLDDRPFAEALARRARERVRAEFLGVRQLMDYARLLAKLVAPAE